MPGMDGYEKYQGLVQVNPSVKIIFSSGYDEKEVMQHFDGAGLVGFLKKPYNLSKLIQTVKQHMGL
jgi:CheY-like chemotaxis protein